MSNKIRFNFIKIVGQERSEASNRYVYVAYIPLKCLKKDRFFVLWSFKKLYEGCFFLKGHRKRTYFFFHGFQWDITKYGASLMAQTVKNPPIIWETWVQSLGWKIPWRGAWQPTPVFLPGESPWTEEPGGLQSMESQRVRHNWGLSTAQHRGQVRGIVLSYRICDMNGHLESSQLQWYPTRPKEPTGTVPKALTIRNANPVALNKTCSPFLSCKQKPPKVLCT